MEAVPILMVIFGTSVALPLTLSFLRKTKELKIKEAEKLLDLEREKNRGLELQLRKAEADIKLLEIG